MLRLVSAKLAVVELSPSSIVLAGDFRTYCLKKTNPDYYTLHHFAMAVYLQVGLARTKTGGGYLYSHKIDIDNKKIQLLGVLVDWFFLRKIFLLRMSSHR